MKATQGDEVYFHFRGEPRSGKVLCAGKDGCIVEHEGKQHKLKWGHIAGHKTRVPQNYKVLEHGEDGLIVQNQHGQRRFLSTPPEARAERLARPPVAGGELVKAEAQGVMPSLAAASIRGLQHVSEKLVETVAGVQSIVEAVGSGAMANGRSEEIRMLAASVDQMMVLQAQMIEAMKAIAESQPVIHVSVPEQPGPVVHVAVPEQAAPVVQVNVPGQPAPVINVNVPEQPTPHITVEMPEPRRGVTEIQRDRDGNITGAVQKEA